MHLILSLHIFLILPLSPPPPLSSWYFFPFQIARGLRARLIYFQCKPVYYALSLPRHFPRAGRIDAGELHLRHCKSREFLASPTWRPSVVVAIDGYIWKIDLNRISEVERIFEVSKRPRDRRKRGKTGENAILSFMRRRKLSYIWYFLSLMWLSLPFLFRFFLLL